ncbi:MAG TPA: ferritin-like domain-containing protein [Dongiaceae bacterium]|nr:ferritin-like domain-containing protein [Dongiaceae bacterium]
MTAADSLGAAAVGILSTADPAAKARRSRDAAAAWRAGALAAGEADPPDRPARPARPLLLPAAEMPKRKTGPGLPGRVALLHALAHIELNAVDLAWDLIARFGSPDLPRAFLDDWVGVAEEEARHFQLLSARLAELGAAYGDLPAHDGLWQAALTTRDDLLARLAIAPLVLEARGLDVTPGMIASLRRHGDAESAAALEVIYREEIGHVAAGRRWFEWLSARRGLVPEAAFQDLVRRHFRGRLKPPFNAPARDAAGLTAAFYMPLVAEAEARGGRSGR